MAKGVVIGVVFAGLIILISTMGHRNEGPKAFVNEPSVTMVRHVKGAAGYAACAPSHDDAILMVDRIQARDGDAIEGLIERGKLLQLKDGTAFEVNDYKTAGFAWGFVRSGRELGKDCYIPVAFLDEQ